MLIAPYFFELSATSAYTDISPTAPTQGFQHPELIAFLKSDPDLFRIDTRTDIAGLWQPDTAALYGLQDVGGIDNPLILRHWNAFWEATGGRQTDRYDLLNVKYVIVRDGTPLPEGKFVLAFDAPGELAVYRNQDFLPRAWLAEDTGTLDQLTPAPNAPAAQITHYGANEMTIIVQPTTPAYLVLSELWYPGWQATVNGAPAEVLRVNQALRAVAVPAGDVTVQLWFAPRSWQWGLLAGTVGLILTGLCLWLRPRLR
ncbi:MAG: YfhO family protein [Nitrospiraceae bacterium]|nr:YfhO family protein [Nitrospiraceae bacterium]